MIRQVDRVMMRVPLSVTTSIAKASVRWFALSRSTAGAAHTVGAQKRLRVAA